MDEFIPDASTPERWFGWLRAGQAGDSAAMNQLLAEVRPFLDQVVRKQMRGQNLRDWDASDVVQKCLVKVSQVGAELRATTEQQFRSWLATMARNLFLDEVRDGQRQKRGGDQKPGSLPEDSHGVVQVPSDASTPSQQAMRREDAEQLEAALSRLSEAGQQVIRLRCYDKLAWSEIADRMGKTEAAVQQLYFRGLKRLKEVMGAKP